MVNSLHQNRSGSLDLPTASSQAHTYTGSNNSDTPNTAARNRAVSTQEPHYQQLEQRSRATALTPPLAATATTTRAQRDISNHEDMRQASPRSHIDPDSINSYQVNDERLIDRAHQAHPLHQLSALYLRRNTESAIASSHNDTQSSSPYRAFSLRVQRLIDHSIIEGQTVIDLSHRAISLKHLEKYYSLINTSNQRENSIDSIDNTIAGSNACHRHPTLIVSGQNIIQQLMLAEPALTRTYANRITHLLAMPTDRGGIRFNDTECSTSRNAQIQAINLQADACDDLSGIWHILNDYHKRFEPHTNRAAFFTREFAPFITLYKEQSAHDSVISELQSFNQFFSSLTSTREYNNNQHRDILLSRAVSVLQQMRTNDSLFHDIVMLAGTNLEDCVDRRANTLLDMELRCELQNCSTPGQTRENLFEQGLKFLRLHIAEQFAWQNCMHLLRATHGDHISRNSDEAIEVILYLRINLRDVGLPLTGAAMNYPTSINFPSSTLDRIREAITQDTGRLSTLQAFFRTWDPWMTHMERDATDITQHHLENAYNALDALEQRRANGEINEFDYVQALNTLQSEREQAHGATLQALSDQRVEEMFLAHRLKSKNHEDTDTAHATSS